VLSGALVIFVALTAARNEFSLRGLERKANERKEQNGKPLMVPANTFYHACI